MEPNLVDLLLTGGAVHTVSNGTAEAVAVRGGRIAAVGSASDLASMAGPAARVVDLEGRTVLPGFQDAHLHPPHGGLLAIECNLHDAQTAEECLDTIARYAAEHPEREWIAGSGWSMDSFPGGTPDRESLDAVVADRPVFVTNRDGHGAWVNSRALELARRRRIPRTDGSSEPRVGSRSERFTKERCAPWRSSCRRRPRPNGSKRS
jgi:predicted amidohydrolase YtcJ